MLWNPDRDREKVWGKSLPRMNADEQFEFRMSNGE